jgi:integral membrane protein (TIGR01906 family)
MPSWLIRVVQTLVALALPLMLLLGNVQLLMHPRFVHYEYDKGSFPADTAIPLGGYPLSRAERTALAEAALQSIVGPQGMRALEEARFQKTDQAAFNAREIRHMRDVRWLFQRARAAFWVALLALIGGVALLTWRESRGAGRRMATRSLLVSVVGTLSVAAALGLYILLSFNSFFTRFHHAFFEGDTWRFHQDDTLIRLFPTDFWFDAAVVIAGLTAVELLLIGIGAWWWGRKMPDTDEHG